MIYHAFFKLVLSQVEAERARRLASFALRAVARVPGVRALLRRFVVPSDRRLEVSALGLTFQTPLGAAAGVDKDASWYRELALLGFGAVEVGTVTAQPQEGNPAKPRVVRLIPERGLLNAMGFPNPGARAVAARLRRHEPESVLGVNIGKSQGVPLEDAGDDYRASVRELAPHAAYLVVNVSSPNTPGLRDMQAADLLRPLLKAVRDELASMKLRRPILVKVGPDLSNEELDDVADTAIDLELDGIIAVNTTVDRSGVTASAEVAAAVEGGGVSGGPLKARAIEVLEHLHSRVGDRLTLISVGGIDSAEDALERILAGATLVQAYTGFVYEGPGWPARMNRKLARLVEDREALNIQELVGRGRAATSGAPSAGRPDLALPRPTDLGASGNGSDLKAHQVLADGR